LQSPAIELLNYPENPDPSLLIRQENVTPFLFSHLLKMLHFNENQGIQQGEK
jgi:hypothetical protein